MEKKFIVILVFGCFCLFIAALLYAPINLGSGEEETYDFGVFTMNIPKNTNFEKSVDVSTGMMTFKSELLNVSYLNKTNEEDDHKIIDSLVIGKTMIDGGEDLKDTNSSLSILFYENKDNGYSAVIENRDVFIVIDGENLNQIVDMVNSLHIKPFATTSVDNSLSDSNDISDSNNVNSNQNNKVAVYGDWQRNYETGTFDEDGNPIIRSVMSTSGGQSEPGIYESYWSINGPRGEIRVG